MTRVSLREAYDNKDVVGQIYAIRDTAESAEDNAEQAVTTANTASDHVDALVPQVEGAVQNANSASASAQASAQTVAGYENRLATVEDATEDLAGDLNAVTLRVQTAEGQIVTIQGRVIALETADGQNVKINRINEYAVGLTGNQTKTGTLTLKSQLIFGDNVDPRANLVMYGRNGNRRIILDNIEEDITALPDSTVNQNLISWCDKNDRIIVNLGVFRNTNGSTQLMAYMLKSDGTYAWRIIATSE